MVIATGAYASTVSGLPKTGATRRAAQLAAIAKALGGRLEAIYFGLADNDTFTVLQLPGTAAAAALAKSVNAAGTGHCNIPRRWTRR